MTDVAGSSKELLVQRLRTWPVGEIGKEAADEIERLQAGVKMLENVVPSAKELIDSLARFADHNQMCPRGQWDHEGDDPPECTCGLNLLLEHAKAYSTHEPGHDESKCWEPCGQLGKSEAHAVRVPDETLGHTKPDLPPPAYDFEDLLLRAGRELRAHMPQGTRLIEEIEIRLGRLGITKGESR